MVVSWVGLLRWFGIVCSSCLVRVVGEFCRGLVEWLI